MTDPIQLHPESVDALADAIAEKLGAPSRAVLTLSEAIAATGKKSDSGFYRWAKVHGIKQVAQGRYSRAAIERALADEAGISYRRHQITGRRDPLGRQGVAP